MASLTSPRRTKADSTRGDFLRAGEAVFARQGYVKAEIAAMIAEAGRARGTFYLYFRDKADLLRALVTALQAELEAAGLSRDAPFTGPPAALLHLLWCSYRPHAGTFRALVQAAAVDPDFAALLSELRGYVRRDVAAMIGAGRADPYLAACLETMIVHCLYDWLAADPAHPIAPADEPRALAALVAAIERAVAS